MRKFEIPSLGIVKGAACVDPALEACLLQSLQSKGGLVTVPGALRECQVLKELQGSEALSVP